MTDSTEQDIRVRGTLADEDGVGVVRIDVTVPSSPDEVWAAVTRPERLAAWYGRIDGDLRVGGGYHAVLIPSGWDGAGRVLECEPGSRILVEGAEPGKASVTDELRLTDAEPGSTRLVWVKTGVPVEMIAAYGVGTQIHLENLAAHLAGRGPVDPDPYWEQLLPEYERLHVHR